MNEEEFEIAWRPKAQAFLQDLVATNNRHAPRLTSGANQLFELGELVGYLVALRAFVMRSIMVEQAFLDSIEEATREGCDGDVRAVEAIRRLLDQASDRTVRTGERAWEELMRRKGERS